MRDKVMIIAFDGMDYDLINEFNLEAIKQEEFGTIDNNTGIKYRYTSELFASFITGTNYEEHGVVRLRRSDKHELSNQGIIPSSLREKYRGFWRLNKIAENIYNKIVLEEGDKFKYSKKDLRSETLFEQIELSKPPFVPSYNPDLRWQLGLPHKVSTVEDKDDVREYSKKMTESRLSEFYELSFDFWDL